MLTSSLISCQSGVWSDVDQDKFIEGCLAEGGEKRYCECYLKKVMEYTSIAEEAERIPFEERVKLAKDCD